MHPAMTPGLDPSDRLLIRAAQEGVPVVARPYRALGRSLGMSEGEVVERLARLVEAGIVRRISPRIAHRAAGFTANAVVVWRVPEGDVEAAGQAVSRFDEVSHCYERATSPDWPYNLYAVIHARTREECERAIRRICQAIGNDDRVTLYSEREFKKTRIKLPDV